MTKKMSDFVSFYLSYTTLRGMHNDKQTLNAKRFIFIFYLHTNEEQKDYLQILYSELSNLAHVL